jgi:hypothetical protein
MLTPADCDKRPDSPSCSPWYIAGRLGRRERSATWILREIQKLMDHAGFPPPIVQLDGRGQPVAGLRVNARWQREPVDRWFDSQPSARLPERLVEAAELTEQERTRRRLARRSAAIGKGLDPDTMRPVERGRRRRRQVEPA